MDLLRLAAGVLLPWLAGALLLVAVEARATPGYRPHRLRQAGYGFFLGYALLAQAVLASDAWFGHVSWLGIMALLALVAVGSAALFRPSIGTIATAVEAQTPLRPATKLLLALLAAWFCLHLLFAALEVFNQPLYPWDAWLAWVYRAKAWYLAGDMVDVVSPSQWTLAASADVYTIDAWTYPLFPSVVPYWAALSLGRWSETLINLPVLLAGIAISLGLYGQCRESGMGLLLSVAACYLLISIPLFATHIALAGYADLWMAGFVGLGFIALMRGAMPGQRFQTALGLPMIALAMGVKNEGTAWFLAALLMQALITFHWRSSLIAGLAIVAVVWTAYLMGLMHVEIPLIGTLGLVDGRLHIPFIGHFALKIHDIWGPYRNNFFAMGSWNLLWVLVAAGMLLALTGGERTPNPARRAGAVFIGIFLVTQLFIFGLTDQGAWADSYTAINRLPLHFVPALIFAALVIACSRAKQAQVVRTVSNLKSNGSRLYLWRILPASLLAAAVVVIGSLIFLTRGLPENPVEAHSFAIADFEFVMGSGSADGDRVAISGFVDGYALLSSGPIAIPASDYRFLRFDLDRRAKGANPTVFWRRSDAPEELIQVPVWKPGPVMIDLSTEDDWRGEVAEFGFLFEESSEPVSLGPVKLAPDTLARRVQLTWRNWTTFEPWSQKSINFLQGGTSIQPIRLPVLLTAWLVLTLLIVRLLAERQKMPDPRQFLAVGILIFLTAWMTLDLRWTANSLAQSKRTAEKFWGASEDERLERTLDGDLYSYIQHLKQEVLPRTPSRILIVGDGNFPDYLLQRAKYHLLPNSAFGTRKLPDSDSPHSLGFVLYFGETGALHRVPGWDASWRELLPAPSSKGFGELYEIRKPN